MLMKFRKDINGLRAIAVLAVVVFHFNPSWLSGGFSGVDIFFAISGFLMTSILVGRYDEQKLSVWLFYCERGRRILPALVCLCAALLAYGTYSLSPIELSQLAKHVVSSLLFVSNATYWMEAGYFDAASDTKWLLHTWSLSVEWQFYIIYPFIIIGCIKFFGRKRLGQSLIFICILSYAMSVLTPVAYQTSAFYLLYSRAWEMLLGGLVCLYPLSLSVRQSKVLELSGLALICATYILVRESFSWPGYLAAIPVMGSCMLLAANRQNSALTGNPLCQFLGRTSYSIYLWHWPIVVFMRQHHIDGLYSVIVGMVTAVFIGSISYYFIESKFRKQKIDVIGGNFFRKAYLPTLYVVVMMLGGGIYYSQGIPSRYDGKINELTEIKDVYSFFGIPTVWRNGICHSAPIGMSTEERLAKCAEPGSHKIFLWGDSYAAALYPGLLELQKKYKHSFAIEQFTDGNGAPFFRNVGVADNKKNIEIVNQEKLDILAKMKPEKVIITWMTTGSNAIQNHTEAVIGIKDTIARIKKASPNTKVIIVGPVPQWNNTLVAIMLSYWRDYKTYPPKYISYGLNKSMFDWDTLFKSSLADAGVTYISALDILCHADECLTRVNDEAKGLITADWGHLSPAGSIYFVDRISDILLK